ncbi:MAG: ATP-binding cassette domain-containing protein [Actinobacteria bacterium]|nr:ATP-binding cassette domain-containing protein [Actinomycetota bacterium]MSX48974.1 ATP-binding cassette domain-containing protein [Actinomycetota bacterium]MSY09442.1 ATP-binding cassette domain-containing protein [Actinomycetota bacterium]MSY54882.1 ATP-binding cassette domain-containing protein [Actinomycetota bacterium]
MSLGKRKSSRCSMSEKFSLSIEDLHVSYQLSGSAGKNKIARAVDGVSLQLHPGETLALVGESGSGKTSIANAVMRLLEPTSGKILLDGVDLVPLQGSELRAMRRNFQMIFQDPFESLDPRQRVIETVMEPLEIHGIGENQEQRRVLALAALAQAGLRPAADIGDRFTHQLSGGQRQRVAIASAIILKPSLIIADEPVSMLDVSLRAGILRVMADLRDQLGVSYLFITHDLSLAWMFADRIAVIYLGRIVEEASAVDLIENPMHPYTKALVSVIPVPEAIEGASRTILSGEIPSPSSIPSGCRFHPRCPLFRELGEPEKCLNEDPLLQISAKSESHLVACFFSDPSKGDTQ